jgi:hypothetical protein
MNENIKYTIIFGIVIILGLLGSSIATQLYLNDYQDFGTNYFKEYKPIIKYCDNDVLCLNCNLNNLDGKSIVFSCDYNAKIIYNRWTLTSEHYTDETVKYITFDLKDNLINISKLQSKYYR